MRIYYVDSPHDGGGRQEELYGPDVRRTVYAEIEDASAAAAECREALFECDGDGSYIGAQFVVTVTDEIPEWADVLHADGADLDLSAWRAVNDALDGGDDDDDEQV